MLSSQHKMAIVQGYEQWSYAWCKEVWFLLPCSKKGGNEGRKQMEDTRSNMQWVNIYGTFYHLEKASARLFPIFARGSRNLCNVDEVGHMEQSVVAQVLWFFSVAVCPWYRPNDIRMHIKLLTERFNTDGQYEYPGTDSEIWKWPYNFTLTDIYADTDIGIGIRAYGKAALTNCWIESGRTQDLI